MIGRDIEYLAQLWDDLRLGINTPITVLEDNESAIGMTVGLIQHKRSKHIALRYHYIRQLVGERQLLRLRFQPTHLNPADLMTKPLGRILFARHASVVMGHKPIPLSEQDLDLEHEHS